MSHIGGTNDARNLEDEFAVLARETPAAIDDEPGTTMRAGEARLSYPHDEFDEDGDELTLFAIPIASLSRRVRFFLSVSATLFFYVCYGYLQEWLFSEPGFTFSLFVTLMQFVTFATFSYIDMAYHRWKHHNHLVAGTAASATFKPLPLSLADSRNPPPQRLYFFMGCLLVVSFGMSNMSMLYLTYPTKVILKACKLIPVMLLGLSVQGRGYSSREYASAFALVVGLAFFTLGDKIWLLIAPASADAAVAVRDADVGKSTSISLLIGIFLMSLSLVADSYLGNLQERTLAKHRCTPQQLVFYNSTVGAGILAVVTLLNGELYAAIVYSVVRFTLFRVLVLTFVGYLGVSVYLVLVKTSGIFVATIVATIRKFITIVLSFFFFPKPFSLAHGLGLGAVAVGIALNMQTKAPHKR